MSNGVKRIKYFDRSRYQSYENFYLHEEEWEGFPNLKYLKTIVQHENYVEFSYGWRKHRLKSLQFSGTLCVDYRNRGLSPLVVHSISPCNYIMDVITERKYHANMLYHVDCDFDRHQCLHYLVIDIPSPHSHLVTKLRRDSSDFKNDCSQCSSYNDLLITNNCCKFKE